MKKHIYPDRDKKALEKLTRARAGLIIDQPFFGSLALRLTLREDKGCPTLWVDGRTIGYNPDFINELTPTLVKSAVGHEVGHCVFAHIARRGSRNPRRWNIAGDYVVNAMLKDAGFELGDKWLFNTAFAGMTADHIYNLLPEDDGGEGGEGGEGGLCDIRDGTSGEGEDKPASGDECEREWKVATAQAANAARMQGKLPKSLERFIDDLVNPKVDWRAVLRRFITQTAQADYSWARPNRRMLAHDIYLPRLWSESMGELVVGVDTSGSIDAPTLNAFGAEIRAIAQDTRPTKITVIYCDAAVNRVDEFGPDDDVQLVGVGGGGTSFLPPFNHVAEHGIEPVAFIYLTDGYGPFPPEPDYPVLWVMTTDIEAPMGETVPITI